MNLESPKPDPTPIAYVVELRTQRCNHCHRTHQLSETYSKHTMGHNGFRLRPLSYPVAWNLPIQRLTRAMEHVPFCHECAGTTFLDHLPTPPSLTEAKTVVSVARDAPSPSKPRPATPRRVATVDDL